MTIIPSTTSTLFLRPLAAATVVIYATAIAAWMAVSVTQAAARALLGEPPIIAITNCNDSGAGSLRDAIHNAVSGDIIDLTLLTCGRISLTTGALDIDQPVLTLTGPGAGALAIDGSNRDRIFHTKGSETLTLQAMSIANGTIHRRDSDADDAAGGCIYADGNVVLSGVNVRYCEALAEGSRTALGGAVWARGQVDLEYSRISGNFTYTQGSGYARGGGLYASGGLFMVSSTLADNAAYSIAEARSVGGGAFVRGGVVIASSTVSMNEADRSGGLDLDDNAGNPASLISSTVSGNSARLVGGISARPVLQLYNSTIAFNRSSAWTDTDSAGHHFAAGVHVFDAIRMNSTIISNNVNAGAPSPTADLTGADGARFFGHQNNVMACDITCATDTTSGDPGLHPLRFNGGVTQTHLPTGGSWNALGGNNVDGVIWDQRGPGFPRNSRDGWIDIGALQIEADGIFRDDFEQIQMAKESDLRVAASRVSVSTTEANSP
ncbi:MAG: choice-of-anchor Q domain-containing protein [Dokdonella sp.]